MRPPLGLLAGALASVMPATLPAQRIVPPPVTLPTPAAQARVPGDELTVQLMTVGQGDPVWEKFGHNAIVIVDASTGAATAYNWGIFDFRQPRFIQRFLTGDTRYWVAGYDAQAMVDFYRGADRTVQVQRLNLTAAQKLALRAFIEWNVREENKFYRYDYYRDNCSTRVRDALDRVLGGALRAATVATPGDGSFRWHTQRLVADNPATYTGITIALGARADSTLSRWDEMFIPMKLRDRLREVRVRDDRGGTAPLVVDERTVYEARRAPERAEPPRWTRWYLLAGLIVGAAIVGAARAATRGRAVARRALLAAAIGWALAAVVVGVIIWLAGHVTRHVYWADNTSVALFSPAWLLVLFPFGRLLRGRAVGPVGLACLAVGLIVPLVGIAIAFVSGGGAPIAAFMAPVVVSVGLATQALRARPVASSTAG